MSHLQLTCQLYWAPLVHHAMWTTKVNEAVSPLRSLQSGGRSSHSFIHSFFSAKLYRAPANSVPITEPPSLEELRTPYEAHINMMCSYKVKRNGGYGCLGIRSSRGNTWAKVWRWKNLRNIWGRTCVWGGATQEDDRGSWGGEKSVVGDQAGKVGHGKLCKTPSARLRPWFYS